MKNAHLLRYQAPSPSRGRGKESLLIRRDATIPRRLRTEALRHARVIGTILWGQFMNCPNEGMPGALHLDIFDQPNNNWVSTNRINNRKKG